MTTIMTTIVTASRVCTPRPLTRAYPSLAVPIGAALGVAVGALIPLSERQSTSSAKKEVFEAVGDLGRALQAQADGRRSAIKLDRAWSRIDECLQSGDDKGEKLAKMLTLLRGKVYEGSHAQRILVDSAWDAGLAPHVRVFNAMIEALQFEARGAAAVDVLRAEMARRGVRPNAETHRLVSLPAAELEHMRASEIRRLLLWGWLQSLRNAPASPSVAAWALWDRLVESREAAPSHLAIMLRYACHSAEEQARLADAAAASGCTTDVYGYAVRLTRLQLEGQPQAAIDSLVAEMGMAGVVPDAALQRALARQRGELSSMRTAHLTKLLTYGARHAGRAFYEGLLARGAVDQYQLATLLSHGTTSMEEVWAALDAAEAAGVAPDANCLNVLISRMALEGRPQVEVGAMLDIMKARGVQPDATTRRIIDCDAEDLGRKRTALLKRWLDQGRGGDHHAVLAAWHFFSALCERGAVNGFHVDAMAKSASRAERGDLMLDDPERHLGLYAQAESRFRPGRHRAVRAPSRAARDATREAQAAALDS